MATQNAHPISYKFNTDFLDGQKFVSKYKLAQINEVDDDELGCIYDDIREDIINYTKSDCGTNFLLEFYDRANDKNPDLCWDIFKEIVVKHREYLSTP